MSSLKKYKKQSVGGIYFGEKKGFFNSILRFFGENRSYVKPAEEEGNAAIIGGNGSGKSRGIVQPTLRIWNGTFFALDIKGELQAEYEKLPHARNFKVFSLWGNSEFTYNPFAFISENGEANKVLNIKELSQSLIPLPINAREPFWILSAQNILSGGLLYYYDLGTDFIDSIVNIIGTPPNDLILEIAKSDNEPAKIFINNFISTGTAKDENGNEFSIIKVADSKLLTGVSQELTNRLSIFATDTWIRNSLIPSEKQIYWTDLEKMNIFLSVPEYRLEQYSTVLTMMITQMFRTLERRPEKYSRAGENIEQILIMLDELPRIGKIEALPAAVSTLRSKKVTICLICQSLAQYDCIYGKEIRRIILDNCTHIAILRITDAETQQYFSDLIGTVEVQRRSKSTSYDTDKNITGYSEQVSCSREAQVQAHTFATQKDIALITPEGFTRVKKNFRHDERPSSFSKICSGVKRVVNEIKNGFKKVTSFLAGLFR